MFDRNGNHTYQEASSRRLLIARLVASILLAGSGLWSTSAFGQASQPYIGELLLVPYNFVPVGWAACNGQLLPIQQNTALFSLLGTTYGGDGVTSFALPDLRGRVPISTGQAPGLQNYALGQTGGQESVTLTTAQMPAHTHGALCDTTVATTDRPGNALPARNAAAVPQYGTNGTGTLAGTAIASAGGGQPHENRPPFLTLQWIIATQGVFPTHP
jgi:microcystin-dependent protein